MRRHREMTVHNDAKTPRCIHGCNCLANSNICHVLKGMGFTNIFTARRNARIASAVLAIAIPSVRLSVCLSDIRRYCVKTTARSTAQFAPLDSKMRLVCRNQKIFPRDDPFPMKFWLQVTYPLLKAASFDTFCLVAPQP